MQRYRVCLFGVLGLMAGLAGNAGDAFAAPTPITLEDAFQAAIRRSEVISDQDERVLQAQEIESQAFGSILPNAAGNANYLIQKPLSDPLAREFFPSYQPTVKLTVSQPLFRGLREFATLRKLGHLTESQKHDRELALMQLYVDVAHNFFTLLAYEQEIHNLGSQMALYQDRIDELLQRTRTGQSSESEPLVAQASKATVQAELKQNVGNYKAAREVFSFLTGMPSDSKLVATPERGERIAIDEYLKTIEKRPDILSAHQKIEGADAAVSVAKGAHLPTADLQGNYYLVRPAGVLRDINWDVQAVLSIPIYAGGVIQAQVRQASSQRMQAELALSRARRQAEQEIRSLYDNYESNQEQIQALEESMALSEKTYLVLKRDYTRGLTRNIDVLQALTQFQQSKRALDQVRWTARSNLTKLRILSASQSLPKVRN